MQKQQEMLTTQPKKHRILGPCSLDFNASNTGSWRLERPTVDFDKCIRCGTCNLVCPTNCITFDKLSDEPVKFDWYYCKGCGVCVNECPKQCMEMVDERGAK